MDTIQQYNAMDMDTIWMPYGYNTKYNILNILQNSTKMLPHFLYKVQPVS